MKIVACVKQVPDTWAEKKLTPDDHTVDREAADGVLNELDEYAVEEALRLAEAHGGEVTLLSMGPEKAAESIRKGLQMGADAAVQLCDEALAGSDAVGTSAALAKALAGMEFDLAIFGVESTDARMGVLPAMVAEQLGLPQLTQARKVEVAEGTVRIERLTDTGYDVVEAAAPAILSVVEKINEPRYPSFKGIMAAKKKPYTTRTVADLGVGAEAVGLAGAPTEVVSVTEAPPRQSGTVITDSGDGGKQLADFLAAKKFI